MLTDLYRIVGFEVVPLSIRHEYQGEWPSDPVKEKAMKVECHPSKVEAMSLTNV